MWNYNNNRTGKWHPRLNGKKWNDSEIAYLIECGNSTPLVELSAALKRSRHSVGKMRSKLGLGRLKSYQVWEKQEIDFLKRNAGKMAAQDIARKLGRSMQSVYGKASYMGILLLCIGENCSSAIHSDEDVLLCRELHIAGVDLKLIAEKMEISPGAVQWIIYGSRKTQQDRATLEFERMDSRR